MFAIPPKGAQVWIEFEAGDVSKPIWSGCWWPKDKLPKGAGGKPVKPAVKLLRSEQGLRVALDDDKQTISLGDVDGKNLLTIAVKDGQVTIKAAKKVVIDCPAIELVARRQPQRRPRRQPARLPQQHGDHLQEPHAPGTGGSDWLVP